MARSCLACSCGPGALSIRHQVRFGTKVIFLLIAISGLAGCWHHRVEMVAPEAEEQSPISFVQDGQTTKSDVTAQFGTLAASFEDGRILVFALDKKYRVTESEKEVKFHLVLVFDEEGGQVLQKHSLVRIK